MTRTGLAAHPQFLRFWLADVVSIVGSQITAVAIAVVAVTHLDATETEMGLLNAARWVPYLGIGLIAGVIADRMRRRPLLVGSDLGRAALLLLIPALWLAGRLSMTTLIAVMLVFGLLALLYDAAHQSFVPRIVPAGLLTSANARLVQSESIASLTGPVIGAGLLKVLAAPLVLVVDALSYLFSGILLARMPVTEQQPSKHDRHLRREVGEGLRWVYRHRHLAWIALTSHARFLFASMVIPLYALLVLRDLALGTVAFGLNAAFAGIGGLLGGALAGRAATRLGAGGAIALGRVTVPLGTVLLILAPPGPAGWVMTGACQLLYGIALGVEAPNDMGYRQSITPDRLQGRMNATIRSFNWGTYALGSVLGGILADAIGIRPTLWIAVTGMLAAAGVMALSPGRRAALTGHTAP